MRRTVLLLLALAPVALGQRTTERYLPIGQSPGLSGKRTYMGKVGTATVVMSITRTAAGAATAAYVDFVMNAYYGAEEVSRAMHIHRGGANDTGPVVLDSSIGNPITAGPGNATFVRRNEFVSTACA